MQNLSFRVHQTFSLIAAATPRIAIKSMLSGTARCSELSPFTVRNFNKVAVRVRFRLDCERHSVASFLFRGPGLCQSKHCHRLFHIVCVRALHATYLSPVQPAIFRPLQRSRSSKAAVSMQAPQEAVAQQEGKKDQRIHQKADGSVDNILLQADHAVQPFLASPTGQPERARVDYSKSQRPLQVVDPEIEMINPADWDVVCDVRTPDEFEEDRLIGAINTPVLGNEQRAQVGTMYKQVGQHEAKRLGAALISQNIAGILLDHFQTQGKQMRILVYCWRGGERSQSLAHVLSRVGWEVAVIKRGYMGYRNQVRRCMEVLGRFQYHVIGGATGSGKGKLLDALRDHGGQVVDLEVAADHRGSILGDHPTRLQPPQKMFESKLLHQMRSFSVDRPVFIESESSLVGRRQVPNSMWKGMQTAAQVTELEVPLQCRVAWLRKNYSYFEDEHRELLMAKLDALTKTSGKKLVAKWRELAEQSRWDEFVAAMLQEHYDVVYTRAQLKFLTPSTSDHSEEQPADQWVANTPQSADSQSPSGQDGTVSNGHVPNGASNDEHGTRDGDDTVGAAGALSHLFGGSRQKLVQQMNSKEQESTLRWHREPVSGVTDEIYNALARRLLGQYDFAALN